MTTYYYYSAKDVKTSRDKFLKNMKTVSYLQMWILLSIYLMKAKFIF